VSEWVEGEHILISSKILQRDSYKLLPIISAQPSDTTANFRLHNYIPSIQSGTGGIYQVFE
jgi:hypothetical protein